MNPRVLAASCAALSALVLSGCAGVHFQAPVAPPPGLIFANTKAPLMIDVNNTPAGAAAPKEASESTHYVMPFYQSLSFSWDQSRISDIARSGGIEEVTSADYELFNILGIYIRMTVHVHGR